LNTNFEISEKRLLWLTAAVLAALTVGSLSFGNWRVTTGVLLGGGLSFLNLWWLKLSLESLIGEAKEGYRPRFNASLYLLRYLTIALIVMVAVTFRLVTVAATLVGLLSFAFAVLLEAIIQLFYIVIVNREDN
jgi:hypothetical protein